MSLCVQLLVKAHCCDRLGILNEALFNKEWTDNCFSEKCVHEYLTKRGSACKIVCVCVCVLREVCVFHDKVGTECEVGVCRNMMPCVCARQHLCAYCVCSQYKFCETWSLSNRVGSKPVSSQPKKGMLW